ncbi:hypothetical protein [Bradyrhizobium sp. CCBAU 65884]
MCRTIIKTYSGHVVAEVNPGGSTIFQFTARVAELSEET